MAAGAVKGSTRLLVMAGKASPSPAIGQALGPLGVNMMEFCKEFNNRTSGLNEDVPVPVLLTAFENRTFEFSTKSPPPSWFLKKAAAAGPVTAKHVYEIAKVKKGDGHLAHLDEQSLCKSIIGTAKSMGLEVQ